MIQRNLMSGGWRQRDLIAYGPSPRYPNLLICLHLPISPQAEAHVFMSSSQSSYDEHFQLHQKFITLKVNRV